MKAQDFKKIIENHPIMFAQSEIMKSAAEIYIVAEQLSAILIEKGLIENATVSIEPCNSGFEIKFDGTIIFEKMNSIDRTLANLVYVLHSCYLYPDSFFNSNIKEIYGASISGSKVLGCDRHVNFRTYSNEDTLLGVNAWEKDCIEQIQILIEKLNQVNS